MYVIYKQISIFGAMLKIPFIKDIQTKRTSGSGQQGSPNSENAVSGKKVKTWKSVSQTTDLRALLIFRLISFYNLNLLVFGHHLDPSPVARGPKVWPRVSP